MVESDPCLVSFCAFTVGEAATANTLALVGAKGVVFLQ